MPFINLLSFSLADWGKHQRGAVGSEFWWHWWVWGAEVSVCEWNILHPTTPVPLAGLTWDLSAPDGGGSLNYPSVSSTLPATYLCT